MKLNGLQQLTSVPEFQNRVSLFTTIHAFVELGRQRTHDSVYEINIKKKEP